MESPITVDACAVYWSRINPYLVVGQLVIDCFGIFFWAIISIARAHSPSENPKRHSGHGWVNYWRQKQNLQLPFSCYSYMYVYIQLNMANLAAFRWYSTLIRLDLRRTDTIPNNDSHQSRWKQSTRTEASQWKKENTKSRNNAKRKPWERQTSRRHEGSPVHQITRPAFLWPLFYYFRCEYPIEISIHLVCGRESSWSLSLWDFFYYEINIWFLDIFFEKGSETLCGTYLLSAQMVSVNVAIFIWAALFWWDITIIRYGAYAWGTIAELRSETVVMV